MKFLKKAFSAALSVSMALSAMAGLTVAAQESDNSGANDDVVIQLGTSREPGVVLNAGAHYATMNALEDEINRNLVDTEVQTGDMMIGNGRMADVLIKADGLENMDSAVLRAMKHSQSDTTGTATIRLYASTTQDVTLAGDRYYGSGSDMDYGVVSIGTKEFTFNDEWAYEDVEIELNTTGIDSSYDYLILQIWNPENGGWLQDFTTNHGFTKFNGDGTGTWKEFSMWVKSLTLKSDEQEAPDEPEEPHRPVDGKLYFYDSTGNPVSGTTVTGDGAANPSSKDQLKVTGEATVTFSNIDTTNLESITVYSASNNYQQSYEFKIDGTSITETLTYTDSDWNSHEHIARITRTELSGGHDLVMTVNCQETYLDWIRLNYKESELEPEPTSPSASLEPAEWTVNGSDTGYTVDSENKNQLTADGETVYGYKATLTIHTGGSDGENRTYTTATATVKKAGGSDADTKTKTNNITNISGGEVVFYIISNAELDAAGSSIVLE